MLNFLARAVLAQLLVGEAFVICYVISSRLLGHVPTMLRWVGLVASAGWLASLTFHLLAALGAFHLLGATLLLGVLTAAVLGGCAADGSWRRSLARDARFLRWVRRRLRRSPQRWFVLAFFAASLPIVVRPLILPPLAWDSLTYHAVKAAMWVQNSGRLEMHGPGTWSYYPNMWAGGEVFTSWAMLLFHSDLLAMEVDAVEWIALGFALVALARELGIREPYASAAAGFALVVPTLRISIGAGYVEAALLVMAVSALALAVRFLERGSLGAFYLSACASGVAASVKFPFFPISSLALAVCVARVITLQASLPTRIARAAAAVSLFALVLAPWPWNAYRETGFPFSPLPIELLGKRLGEATPEMEWYMEQPGSAAPGESEWGQLRQALVDERMGPGLTTMLAVAVSFAAWPFLWRRHRLGLLLVGSTVIATWATYHAPGLELVRRSFASSGVRFLLPALLPSVIVSAAFCRFLPRFGRAYFLFLLAGTLFQLLLYLPYGLSAPGARALVVLLLCLAVGVAAARWIVLWPVRTGYRAAALIALFTFALLALKILRDDLRFELFRREFLIHPIHPYWLEAAAIVDPPQRAHRIAVTSGPWQDLDNWVVYPFLGRAFQNQVLYVPVSGDGAVHHFGLAPLNDEYARTADLVRWEAQLREQAFTEVMSFRPPSIELPWMESHPARFRRLAGETGDWGLFAVLKP
ncbi:MAG: hypothetical protein ABW298_16790 [Candidatus Binatia bacterium]